MLSFIQAILQIYVISFKMEIQFLIRQFYRYKKAGIFNAHILTLSQGNITEPKINIFDIIPVVYGLRCFSFLAIERIRNAHNIRSLRRF